VEVAQQQESQEQPIQATVVVVAMVQMQAQPVVQVL
jgi:hypothetical protein